ncbi:hypothetical protein NM688_g9130 [Phlebia brevispora]|uniref:Uncharacterized protein n=1 Tax=Phlebia brevispora TaxID=194682 RepID=A0ACC1RNG1_9APHY|nr:hypothetical protein NM688_g9130 [Phlebia brevispora]
MYNEAHRQAEAEGRVTYVPSYYLHLTNLEQLKYIEPPPEPGTIRVKFYRKLNSIVVDSPLYEDLRLNPNGEFDLYHVRKRWDLQKLAVVDSTHIEVFRPIDADTLSPLAVHVLMDGHDHLRVIERTTPGRRFARSLRLNTQKRCNRYWTKAKSIGDTTASVLCIPVAILAAAVLGLICLGQYCSSPNFNMRGFNLLKVLTENQVQLQTSEPEFKLLLNAVKEARRQSNDTKQSDAFYDSLEGLLLDLRTVTMDNRDAEAFLKPVTKSEVPDYYDIISQPMDLQTMLRKVKQKQYKSKREFEDDLDLIWSNCFTYNSTEVRHERPPRRPDRGLTRSAKNHPLRQCATRLKAKADKLLKNITDRKERMDPPVPDLHSRGSTPRLNGINGHGRARPVAFTKSPSPSKPLITANGKHHRRDISPSHEPTLERTPEGMAAFLRLDREVEARLSGQAITNGVSGPTLEEQLMEYALPCMTMSTERHHHTKGEWARSASCKFP